MTVAVVKEIKAGFDSDMNLIQNHVYSQGVRFIRSGEESDRLITSLAELYGFSVGKLNMVDGESFTAIALHQGEINMEQQPIKIKLFGRDSDKDSEDEYYESFFNVDLKNRLVFWNEKDQEYRIPLIKGISK